MNDDRIIRLAEKIYIKSLGLQIELNTEKAEAALFAARDFYHVVDRQAHGQLNLIEPESRHTTFDPNYTLKNGFDLFDRTHPKHSEIYYKDNVDENFCSCEWANANGEREVWTNHEYPEWVVCKVKNRNGEILGFNTESLVFDGDIWLPQKSIKGAKSILIYGEICGAAPEHSLISIELPF